MTKAVGRPPRSETEIIEFRTKVSQHAMALYRQDGFEAVSIRRLSKAVGCAPTTLYAHFAGKTEILMLLWAEVLAEMAEHVQASVKTTSDPAERLKAAALAFVSYWIDHPDHFRLVFMSNDVGRSDVDSFIETGDVLGYFQMFADLIRNLDPKPGDVKVRTDALVAGMIGVSLCSITVRNYPWSATSMITNQVIEGITA
ncbi:TetR/AcrR family transcriptional regulator [Ruegeria sp. Alg231-54]|uniref:TetR/AcrR family transcriptional regulator n=1 Tax=Ruegeria sp. Alg231-54 TaxID=1922221 RepID=UPI000D550AFF|nr:TetR/AcrR family transcriptional regulator [Ruegeria sp. Alg231-54]